MVVRDGRYGKFTGCASYPACRGMRDTEGNEIVPKKKFGGGKFKKYKKKGSKTDDAE
jgi:ssDNA-binding Zn-finger/Zn-ribbon topoisomerase 1